MNNLEAYFRTCGIKVAQERFDKPVMFSPAMMLNKDFIAYKKSIKFYTDKMNEILMSGLFLNKPKPMTELEIIDKRLSLFPEYLRYYLDNEYAFELDLSYGSRTPRDVLKLLERTGMMFINGDEHYSLNFDGWLLHNSHSELSDLKPVPMYAIGVDPYYDAENGSFVRDEDDAVVWQKDPNGRWRVFK